MADERFEKEAVLVGMEKLMAGFRKKRVFEVDYRWICREIIGTKPATSNEKRAFPRRDREPKAEILGFGKGIVMDQKRVRWERRFAKERVDRRIRRQDEGRSGFCGNRVSKNFRGADSVAVVEEDGAGRRGFRLSTEGLRRPA